MIKSFVAGISAGIIGATLAGASFAAPVNGTGFLTSDVIFGSGNADGSFTGVTEGSLELALRAKQRYPSPANVFNYDGNNTYTFANNGNAANRSVFNVEWSINTDINETGGNPAVSVGDYSYTLEYDLDPTMGTLFSSRDAIKSDNARGFNGTANGGGGTLFWENPAVWNDYNVSQNSQNMGFSSTFGDVTDPDAEGHFTFRLSAFDGTTKIGSTEIHVVVGNIPGVPVPAALPLMLTGLAGFVAFRRRRKA